MKDNDDAQTIDWVDDTQKQVPVAPATTPELAIVLNHITNVTLQDLLADYEN